MGKQTPPAKPSQVLSINPSTQLTFRGNFREVVNVNLSLMNSSNRRVCFKVKTNYPYRYFVRPNGGLIEPMEQQLVTIMLQPLEFNNDELKLHKFMVQSIFAPEGPIDGLEKLWKAAKPEDIMETKIRCVFELTEPVKQEQPRYRGKELEGNGDATKSSEPLGATSHNDDKSTSSSTIVVLLIILIIFCLIVFGYLKSQ